MYTESAIELIGSVNKRELISIYALMAYKAYDQNMDEEIIREYIADRFCVKDVAQLPSQSYGEVIKFLVDMQMGMLSN